MESDNKVESMSKLSLVFLENILITIMKMLPKIEFAAIATLDDHNVNIITRVGQTSVSIEKYLDAKPLPRGISITNENMIVPLKCDGIFQGILILKVSLNGEYAFNERDVQIIENFVRFVEHSYNLRNLKNEFENIAHVLIKMLEYHDTSIKGHSERVAILSMKIAKLMGMNEEEINDIYWAGYLHDVGKIFVPQVILTKQTKLSCEEYELIKKHPIKSVEILEEISCSKNIIEIVKCHHERWDGRGYPQGLKGFDIPLGSRIVAVVDAYDAMISPRPYRNSLSMKEAIEELKINSGTQFDPEIVEVFLKMVTINDEVIPYTHGSLDLYQETSMT